MTLSLVAIAQDDNQEECYGSVTNYCRAQHAHSYYSEEDEQLNIAYQALLLAISKNAESSRIRKSLESSEMAWIIFRDKICDFVALIEEPGPKMGRSVKCLAKMSRERTEQLVEYRMCLEYESEKCSFIP
jgi:uncharacterized protein YecT (DUF1311 family)